MAEQFFGLVGAGVRQEHLPPVWVRAPCGGPVCRRSGRIGLPDLTPVRNCRNTSPVLPPYFPVSFVSWGKLSATRWTRTV